MNDNIIIRDLCTPAAEAYPELAAKYRVPTGRRPNQKDAKLLHKLRREAYKAYDELPAGEEKEAARQWLNDIHRWEANNGDGGFRHEQLANGDVGISL